MTATTSADAIVRQRAYDWEDQEPRGRPRSPRTG